MLNKETLKSDILAGLNQLDDNNKTDGRTPAEAKAELATMLANAIEKYVTSGEIKIAAQEIAVATSGSATSQTGANTSPITKNLE